MTSKLDSFTGKFFKKIFKDIKSDIDFQEIKSVLNFYSSESLLIYRLFAIALTFETRLGLQDEGVHLV